MSTVTNARVLAIAGPILLSNVTVPLLGAVDTAVVGRLGEAAPIGAVGVGAAVLAFIYWMFGFLRMGIGGLVAQARGAGDGAEIAALLSRGLLMALGGGLLIIALQLLIFRGAFLLMPASEAVEALARDYLSIRIWGAPAAIGVYALTGWLIAMERTRGVFVLQVSMNAVNAVLDVWFVLGLGWGVEGVAVATLIAEATGLCIGLWLCREAFAGAHWRDKARVLDPLRLRRMMALNGDIFVRSALLEGAFLIFVALGARFGDVRLAANQILFQFFIIAAFALDGFAFAAEAMVGHAMGARSRAVLRAALIRCSQWAMAVSAVISLVFMLGGGAFIRLMTDLEPVRAAALAFLPWAVMTPVVGVPAFMLDGAFIGATRSGPMRNAMIASFGFYLIACAVLIPPFGNHGLWAALMLFLLMRGWTLWRRYPALEAAASAPTASATLA